MLPWGTVDRAVLRSQVIVPAGVGLGVVAVCLLLGYRGFMPLTAFGLAGFVVVTTLRELLLPAQQRMAEQKEDLVTAVFRSATRAQRRFGGYVVHLGIVFIVVAVAASSAFKVHTTRTSKVGETMELGAYRVRFDGLAEGKEPHRQWIGANITVISPDGTEAAQHGTAGPRMYYYEGRTDPVGSPMVAAMVWRDVYVSLLAFDAKTNSASFNAWVFPLVGWIWYSIPILVLGTLIALWPRRKQVDQKAPALAGGVLPGSAP